MKREEIERLRHLAFPYIDTDEKWDTLWIKITKEFIELFGMALNELEEAEKKKANDDLSRFFAPETIEKSIECLQKYLNSEPSRKLESEEKSMLHNVTVKHEENKVLEKYWLMRAIKDGDMYGEPKPTPKRVIVEKECTHEPTPNEIAQFLSDSKADFVSVVQNYRFENELPF